MENQIIEKLKEQEEKINAIYTSVEKTRKYFLVVMWVSLIAVVLPLVGLMFAIPSFMSMYAVPLQGL